MGSVNSLQKRISVNSFWNWINHTRRRGSKWSSYRFRPSPKVAKSWTSLRSGQSFGVHATVGCRYSDCIPVSSIICAGYGGFVTVCFFTPSQGEIDPERLVIGLKLFYLLDCNLITLVRAVLVGSCGMFLFLSLFVLSLMDTCSFHLFW